MRKICIINQKGGVGKTTTTISLAQAMANAGKRVLIIDLDPQGNIAECLNVYDKNGLYELIVEEKGEGDCIQEVSENLHVLPSRENLTKAELMLSGEASRETYLKRLFSGIISYDYILLDCPPSLGLLNQNALVYADEAIIPTSVDPLGVQAVDKMLENIEAINDTFGHKLVVSAIVPTMYDGRLKICKESLSALQNKYYEVVSEHVRSNSKLREAPKHQKAIFSFAKSSNGAKDYKRVADFIIQQEKDDEEQLATLIAETA